MRLNGVEIQAEAIIQPGDDAPLVGWMSTVVAPEIVGSIAQAMGN